MNFLFVLMEKAASGEVISIDGYRFQTFEIFLLPVQTKFFEFHQKKGLKKVPLYQQLPSNFN